MLINNIATKQLRPQGPVQGSHRHTASKWPLKQAFLIRHFRHGTEACFSGHLLAVCQEDLCHLDVWFRPENQARFICAPA
ncbi:hypothetical protein [Hymenobacter sp. BT188]|uniref:hypothetical protein n=1 Tax=Hymenobacter sp. BT188 TaxID=2763504 RepID=UPI001650EDE9|nr:hypothetical protein [Hymenobacter sp. BT188]